MRIMGKLVAAVLMLGVLSCTCISCTSQMVQTAKDLIGDIDVTQIKLSTLKKAVEFVGQVGQLLQSVTSKKPKAPICMTDSLMLENGLQIAPLKARLLLKAASITRESDSAYRLENRGGDAIGLIDTKARNALIEADIEILDTFHPEYATVGIGLRADLSGQNGYEFQYLPHRPVIKVCPFGQGDKLTCANTAIERFKKGGRYHLFMMVLDTDVLISLYDYENGIESPMSGSLNDIPGGARPSDGYPFIHVWNARARFTNLRVAELQK